MTSISGLQLDRLQAALGVPAMLAERYRIIEELGRGGMGVVYLAQDTQLERQVAVKIVDPAVATVELETRLQREARLVGGLSHPGIVPIHDLGHHELTFFYVMKYVDGETLERWLTPERSLTERLRMFEKLCEPIAFAHAQGVAHRDLKPANVMIGSFGETLILDWGLARPLEGARESEQVGTPGYHDSSYGAREAFIPKDVFSLGALLYFLLTGRHPRETTEVLQPRAADHTVDARLNAICMRATQPRIADRYATVSQLKEDVMRYLAGDPVVAYQERWHEKAGRWVGRHQLVVSLILVYLAMRIIVQLMR